MDNILELLVEGEYDKAFQYPPEELSIYLSVNQKWLDKYLKFHYRLDFKFELLIEDIIHFKSAPLTEYLIKEWIYGDRDRHKAELLASATYKLKDKSLQQLITSTKDFTIDDVRTTSNRLLQSSIIDTNRYNLVGWNHTHSGDYIIRSLRMLDLIIGSPYEISYSVARSPDTIFKSYIRRAPRRTNQLVAGAGTTNIDRIMKVVNYLGTIDLQPSLNESVRTGNQECVDYLTKRYNLSLDNVPNYYKVVSSDPKYLGTPAPEMVYLLQDMNPINVGRVFSLLSDKYSGVKYLRPRNFLPYLLEA